MITLEYQDLHGRIFQHSFFQPKIVIGRSPECDLSVLESSVSKIHASVFVVNGKTYLADLNSTNGVRVNGQLANRKSIEFGDFIELGDFQFRLVEPVGQTEYTAESGNKKIIHP